MTWTIDQIGDLSNKVIVVTGANSGLGFEATKLFVKNNATVIMASRNKERVDSAIKEIKTEYPDAKLDFIELDLADLKSIQSFTEAYKKKYDKLDVLLNNAGIMAIPYKETKDGFEMQNGVNHFGHFALTAQLFDVIKQTKESRIVNVASIAHKGGTVNLDNIFYQNGGYSKSKSYSRSKLLNLLFTYELDRRVKEKELDVKVIAAHPGVSPTELGRYMKQNKFMAFIAKIFTKFGHDAALGTLPEVRASVDPNAESGEYYGPDGFMEIKGRPVIVKPKKLAKDEMLAKRLWDLSEELTKVKFDV